MVIKPLSDATVCLLGSTQALTTPLSLVKELVDNSLDAMATSIEIIISPNTLDRIEVRDNGHGIPHEDFDALGKRGCTSKLRSFDELKSVSGKSLGFRGEALFSAIRLGKVSVTSKIDGECAATTAKFKIQGGIESQTTVSHPTGTTVCITDFLCSVPVRKQTCLKQASKTLDKIKELLRAYSLARLHIKFILKVTKDTNITWSYSPRHNYCIKQAVSQVIGRDVAKQCIEKCIVFSESAFPNSYPVRSIGKDSSSENNQFIIEMFLPKPDADFSRSSYGQYVSVDSRPLANEKGITKKIVTIFKHYTTNSLSNASNKSLNPFLWLSIKCPLESYDPNVEPAKDDILFINEDSILEHIEMAFKEIYGERQSLRYQSELSTEEATRKVRDNFDLLSRKPSNPSHNVLYQSDKAPPENNSLKRLQEDFFSKNEQKYQMLNDCKISKFDNHERQNKNLATPVMPINDARIFISTPELPEQSNHGNTKISYSWTNAKTNSPKNQTISFRNHPISNSKLHQKFPPTPQPSSDSTVNDSEMNETKEGLSKKSRNVYSAGINSLLPSRMGDKNVPNLKLQSENVPQSPCIYSDEDLFVSENEGPQCLGFISARQHVDTHKSPIFEISRSRRQNLVNKPYISPFKTPKKGSQDNFHQTLLNSHNLSYKSHEKPGLSVANRDLTPKLDYDYRKEEFSQRLHEETHVDRRARSSPHENRYNSATLSLNDYSNLEKLASKLSEAPSKVQTSISDDDPRGYFIRRQNSILTRAGKGNGPKISRAKSLRLPLERIPVGQELHQNLIKLNTSNKYLKNINELLDADEYIQRGSRGNKLFKGFSSLTAENKEDIINLVKEMINKCKKNLTTINLNEIEFKFDSHIVAKS